MGKIDLCSLTTIIMRNVTLEGVGSSPELSAPEQRQRTEQRKFAIERHDSLWER